MTDAEHLDIIRARLARLRDAITHAEQNASPRLKQELLRHYSLTDHCDALTSDLDYAENKVYPPDGNGDR